MMKYSVLFLILIVELIFSSTVLQLFSFFGSAPEILLITIMLYSIIFPGKEGIFLAVVIGVLSDILYGPYLGVNTIAFALIAIITYWVSAKFSQQSILTSILCLFLALTIYNGIIYFLLVMFQGAMPWMIYLRRFNLQYLIINLIVMFILRYFILKLSQHPAFNSDVLV